MIVIARSSDVYSLNINLRIEYTLGLTILLFCGDVVVVAGLGA